MQRQWPERTMLAEMDINNALGKMPIASSSLRDRYEGGLCYIRLGGGCAWRGETGRPALFIRAKQVLLSYMSAGRTPRRNGGGAWSSRARAAVEMTKVPPSCLPITPRPPLAPVYYEVRPAPSPHADGKPLARGPARAHHQLRASFETLFLVDSSVLNEPVARSI